MLIALGNSGDSSLVTRAIVPHLEDPTPIVRGAAIWALACLDPARFQAEKSARLPHETDPSVRIEWQNEPENIGLR